MTKQVLTGITVNGDVMSSGDLIAGSNTTGGTNLYARHHYVNPAGAIHIMDVNGGVVEVFKIGPDGQPASNIQWDIGTTSPSTTWLTVNLSTAQPTFQTQVNATSTSGGVYNGRSGGFSNCVTLRGENSSGTLMGTVAVSSTGQVLITNNNSQTNAVAVSTGHVRAQGFGQASEFNIGTVTTTASVNWSTNGAAQRLTLTSATACTISFTAPPNVGWYTLKVSYPSVGSLSSITWPATVRWAGGSPPSGSPVLGRSSIYRFYYDGTNYWGDAIYNAA